MNINETVEERGKFIFVSDLAVGDLISVFGYKGHKIDPDCLVIKIKRKKASPLFEVSLFFFRSEETVKYQCQPTEQVWGMAKQMTKPELVVTTVAYLSFSAML